MFHHKKLIYGLTLVSLTTFFNLYFLLFTGVSRAEQTQEEQTSKSDRSGVPARRVGGGTRGNACGFEQESLTALIPEDSQAQTTKASPSISFYVPKTEGAKILEFVINDNSDNLIYEKTLTSKSSGGIVTVTIPDKANKLKPNQEYHWYLSVICDPSNRAEDIVVEGYLQQIKLDSTVSDKLNQLTPLEKVDFYTQAGIWYDALANLVTLKEKDCQDPQVMLKWENLLKSVGLEEIANKQACNFTTVDISKNN